MEYVFETFIYYFFVENCPSLTQKDMVVTVVEILLIQERFVIASLTFHFARKKLFEVASKQLQTNFAFLKDQPFT
jgi:hypothetical protein